MTTLNNISKEQQATSNNSSIQQEKFNVVAGSTPFLKSKESGKIFKEGTKEEREFYEKLSKSPEENKILLSLIPKYYGKIHDKSKDYIIIEDLTFGFKKPCIMDIKLGLSHHDVELDSIVTPPSHLSTQNDFDSDDNNSNSNNTNNEKIIKYIKNELLNLTSDNQGNYYKSWLFSKYITTPLLGFCVCGSQKYNNQTKEYEKKSKEQGRSLTESTVRDQLYQFFINHTDDNKATTSKSDIITPIVKRLKEFKDYFENNPNYRFRSSSILFIFEGESSSNDNDDNNNNKADIRLIDFTHTKEYPAFLKPISSELSMRSNFDPHPFFPIDGGYLYGITKLLEILESI